jgi:sulfate adenylyltransferase large subunit
MNMPWLRIVVVGHVDHGKSTLIGRLLHDSGALPDGRLEEIRADSHDGGLEWALLMDHFHEEREQERTIDSTQAFFSTSRRIYRIIDAPGHREFLKNMVTGAAQADAAILVVDVEAGVLEQTRRHVAMLAMLGQRGVIVAINKMDRVDGRREMFETVSSATLSLLDQTGIAAHCVIPISARHGWNLVSSAEPLQWYNGPTLFDALDSLAQSEPLSRQPLRLPVQDVYDLNGRKIVMGRIEMGQLARGQMVACLPSGRTARIASVEKFLERPTSAEAGESIGLTLDEPIEVRRGNILSDPNSPPPVAQRFEANLFWLEERGWTQGDSLLLRCATQETPCRIESVRRRINSSTLDVIATDAARLEATEVGHVVMAVERPIVVEEFGGRNPLGRFVLLKDQRLSAGGTVTEHFRF